MLKSIEFVEITLQSGEIRFLSKADAARLYLDEAALNALFPEGHTWRQVWLKPASYSIERDTQRLILTAKGDGFEVDETLRAPARVFAATAKWNLDAEHSLEGALQVHPVLLALLDAEITMHLYGSAQGDADFFGVLGDRLQRLEAEAASSETSIPESRSGTPSKRTRSRRPA